MSVDVASGAVHLYYEDFVEPGPLPLIWDLRYSTAWLSTPSGCCGLGWTNQFQTSLTRQGDTLEFWSPDSGLEEFTGVDDALRSGRVICSPKASIELYVEAGAIVAHHWKTATAESQRFRFLEIKGSNSYLLEAIDDGYGNRIDLLRDAASRLQAVRLPYGRGSLKIEYNSDALISSVVHVVADKSRLIASYRYDRRRRLTEITDATSVSDRFEYDDHHRLNREIVKDGGVFSYQYDHKGRCVRFTGRDGYLSRTLHFSDAIGVTTVTDSRGASTIFKWLPSGQVFEEIDAQGAVRQTGYDELGRVVSRVDPLGARQLLGYDEHGNLVKETDATGASRTRKFDGKHRPTAETDPDGGVWLQDLDSFGRLIRLINPIGEVWRLTRDGAGNLVQIIQPDGAVISQRFEGHCLVQRTMPDGAIQRFLYDAFGRVTSKQDALGRTRSCEYDVLGRQSIITNENGRRGSLRFDIAGNLVAAVGPMGSIVSQVFGPCGRMLSSTRPDDGKTLFKWGSERNLLEEITDPMTHVMRFERDIMGRVVGEVGFDGRSVAYGYDANGRCNHVVNGAGQNVIIRHDLGGRMIQQVSDCGARADYTYNKNGRLLAASTSDSTIAWQYDLLGRVIKESQGDFEIHVSYDSAGSIASLTTSMGDRVEFSNRGNKCLSSVKVNRRWSLGFERMPGGLEYSRALPGGLSVETGYDNLGLQSMQRLVRSSRFDAHAGRVNGLPRVPVFQRQYERDDVGRIVSRHETDGGETRYAYDPVGRLKQAVSTANGDVHCDYDLSGNLTRQQSSHLTQPELLSEYSAGNRLIKFGRTEYQYDGHGRLATRIVHDDQGGASDTWRYRWNGLDQLVEILTPSGSLIRYGYDALGRRISKQVDERLTRFAWFGGQQIMEWTPGHESERHFWVYSPGSFELLATVQGDEFYSVLSDSIGTPSHLIDETGRVRWRATTSGFGRFSVTHNAESPICHFRFQGQYYDGESGLHFNHFRYYDPESGRYISQDPLGLSGGLNPYVYCPDPINWVDPWGMAPFVPRVLGPDESVNRGMRTDPAGNFIPSPSAGATNGNEMGARTAASVPASGSQNAVRDFPGVTSPADPVGPSTTGNTQGLSGGVGDQADPSRRRVNGSVKVSDLPPGLGAIHDKESGHVTIFPTQDMTFEEFQKKLNEIPWKKGCSGS